MPSKTLQIEFPAAGVVRRLGLRTERGRGPFPAPWAVNVRLEESLTSRLRGGSFVAQAPVSKASPVYRDRAIVLDGKTIAASRLGSHSDFSISADLSDSLRATVFQLSEAGEQGGDVVAVVPHKDAAMLCFTAGETWVLRGDPTTGTLTNVSREVGIVGASAWCRNHDTIFFLSSLGLYAVGADGSGLRPVSDEKVPVELTGVVDASCVLDYYHADGGVYIHRSSGVSWFYDTARDGFWPFQRSTAASHVLMGPFQLGQQGGFHGRVLNLHGNTAAGSADVVWALVPGDTAEEAAANGKAAIEAALAGGDYTGYVTATGTWTVGRSHMAYPRIRAMSVCLWLSSAGAWAFESASLTASASGAWR